MSSTAESSKPWSVKLFPSTLTDKDGTDKVTTTALDGKTTVAVLFSAHWCGPCRSFAPKLRSFYEACKKKDEDALEVVFVSSDHDVVSFKKYLGSMPWLAIPYGQGTAVAKLAERCQVRGIPALVVIHGATGEILTQTGRGDVSDPSASAYPLAVIDKWLGLEKANNHGAALGATKTGNSIVGLVVILTLAVLAVLYFFNPMVIGMA